MGGKHYYRCLGCNFLMGNNKLLKRTFYRVPKDDKRRKLWLESLNRTDLINKHFSGDWRVCEKHFTSVMLGVKSKKLLKSAVPTQIVPETSSSKDQISDLEISSAVNENITITDCKENIIDISSPIEKDVVIKTEKSLELNILAKEDVFDKIENTLIINNSAEEDAVSVKIENNSDTEMISYENSINVYMRNVTSRYTQSKSMDEILHEKLQALKNENEYLKKKNKELEKEKEVRNINQLRLILPEGLAGIVANHINNIGNDSRGWRYTAEFKKWCLSVYFVDPAAYGLVSKLMNMPSRGTLFRFNQNCPSEPGIHESFFEGLKLKIKYLPSMAKNCSICLDEVPLKANLYYDSASGEIINLEDDSEGKIKLPAKYGIVVMIRGITHHYCHLVGYYFANKPFSAKKLKDTIFKCVEELIKIEMTPRVVISDRRANFIGLNKLLGTSESTTYFHMLDHKIYYMYDTPHLLKCFWKNFIKYDILFDKNEKLACWNDVVVFYSKDTIKKQLKLAPKLTKDHIYPNKFQKISVIYAAQAISATVSNGLYTLSSVNDASTTAENTAEIIEIFDKLFDILNSSKVNETKRFRRPFVANKDQLKFLDKTASILSGLQCVEKRKNVTKIIRVTYKKKFLNGWLQNINVLKDLYNDLKEEKISYLLTRNLNQDVLKNIFGILRRRVGNTQLLTSTQFLHAFKKSFSVELMEDLISTSTTNSKSTELFNMPR